MKLFAGVAALLFACSAVLQLNDPDPIRWILIYSSAALLSGASIFVSIPKSVFIVLACAAGLWAATLVPSILTDATYTGTEEEREFGGLVIVAVACIVLSRSNESEADSA